LKILSYINLSSGEKPTPQENQSEVLKALQDQNLLNSGVAGMAELQEDRNESTNFDLLSIYNNEQFLTSLFDLVWGILFHFLIIN